MPNFVYIKNLSFVYPANIIPLFDSVSFQLQRGWTGVVGANGSGKTTLLKLICGELEPDSGEIQGRGLCYYCPQRTDDIPMDFGKFLHSTEGDSFRIKSELQIENGWETRWDTLSHGERKRCQIATALFLNPTILAIDEPSNHLDYASKTIIMNILNSYKGIGLVVSHDRELLDGICQHTLFIFPPRINVWKCNYSTASIELEKKNRGQRQAFARAKKEVRKLRKKVSQQREKARNADKTRSKRQINSWDHDAKTKKDLARLTGKDAVAGRLHERLRVKLDRAELYKDAIEFKKTSPLGISIDVDKARIGFPIIIPSGHLTLGPEKTLTSPDLIIQYGDRIGVIGDNGSGKSTFMHHIITDIPIDKNRILFIPQEISNDDSKLILDRVHNFVSDKLARIMSIVSRLGSNPEHVLETSSPSPGEIRKLMLAEGLLNYPGLIVMDEPTNHMDLPSLQCIEEALNECACSLLLVSHDLIFLKNIVTHFWEITRNTKNDFRIVETNSIGA